MEFEKGFSEDNVASLLVMNILFFLPFGCALAICISPCWGLGRYGLILHKIATEIVFIPSVGIQGQLSAPELLSPPNDTAIGIIDDSCTRVEFSWSPVTNAATYGLEMQQHSPNTAQWESNLPPQYVDGFTNQSIIFCQISSYRWRAVAYDSRSVRGLESDWFLLRTVARSRLL